MNWSLTLKTAPTVEPVSVSELRQFARIDDNDEDTLLETLITAARKHAEDVATWRALITQTWTFKLDEFPSGDGIIELPRPPLVSVTHVKYYNSSNVLTTITNTNYTVVTSKEPGYIEPVYDYDWPETYERTQAVEVEYVAGYGATGSTVPAGIRLGIMQLATHWYEQRNVTVDSGGQPASVPYVLDLLFQQYSVKGFN